MPITLFRNLPPAPRVGWTIEEFERLFDAGFFAPDTRLELIEGEIFEKPHRSPRNATAVMLAQDALRDSFNDGTHVRIQAPMVFGEASKPEPDISVVVGVPRDYLASHPSKALLIVEISETTLETDQTTKSSLYARAGIEDYWIVNLVDQTLEVRRQPFAKNDALFGWEYRSTQIFIVGESVSPHHAPGAEVKVEELLP